MKSLPTIVSYQGALEHNNTQAEVLLKSIFPDLKVPYEQVANVLRLLEAVELDPLSVPYDVIVRTMAYLQETKVNPEILPHVIRGVYNIRIGTGKGQVIVHIDKNESNVQVREQGYRVDTIK
jgi:hypothetical protein